MTEKLIAGIVLMAIGVLFFFNNKNMGKGAFEFYQKFYTKKNLIIIFKITGGILFFGGIILLLQ